MSAFFLRLRMKTSMKAEFKLIRNVADLEFLIATTFHILEKSIQV